jgi:hypothetical protein
MDFSLLRGFAIAVALRGSLQPASRGTIASDRAVAGIKPIGETATGELNDSRRRLL